MSKERGLFLWAFLDCEYAIVWFFCLFLTPSIASYSAEEASQSAEVFPGRKWNPISRWVSYSSTLATKKIQPLCFSSTLLWCFELKSWRFPSIIIFLEDYFLSLSYPWPKCISNLTFIHEILHGLLSNYDIMINKIFVLSLSIFLLLFLNDYCPDYNPSQDDLWGVFYWEL